MEKHHPDLSAQAAKEKEEALYIGSVAYAAFHKGKYSGYFKKHYDISEDEGLKEIRSRAKDKDMSFLQPSQEVHDEIARAQRLGIKVVVLSQSDTDWLEKGVRKAGLSDLLNEDALYGIDKTGHNKHEGPQAYRFVLKDTGFKPGQTATIDDSKGNLKQAVAAGIKETVLVPKVWKFYKMHPLTPKHARYCEENLLRFLTSFNDQLEKGLGTKANAVQWQVTEKERRQNGTAKSR